MNSKIKKHFAKIDKKGSLLTYNNYTNQVYVLSADISTIYILLHVE